MSDLARVLEEAGLVEKLAFVNDEPRSAAEFTARAIMKQRANEETRRRATTAAAQAARAPAPVPQKIAPDLGTSSDRVLRVRDLEAVIAGIAPEIRKFVKQNDAPLLKRIEELEVCVRAMVQARMHRE